MSLKTDLLTVETDILKLTQRLYGQWSNTMGYVRWIARCWSNKQTTRPIQWDTLTNELNFVITSTQEIARECSLSLEIERNLTSIENENKGIMYIGTLIDFYNSIKGYENQFGEDLNLMCQVFGSSSDSDSYDLFRLKTCQIEFSFDSLIDPIATYVPRCLWYKRHVDLFEQKGFGFIDQLPSKGLYGRKFVESQQYNREQTECISLHPQPTEPGVKLQWKGDKTDLAELVWALSKTSRIVDQTTGQPIKQNKLADLIGKTFGLSLDVTGLMKGRMNTYKATSDGETFTKNLFDLVNDRTASA
jgi:hypothetical protein